MVGCVFTKEISTSITDCPYEIHLEVKLTEDELIEMGFCDKKGELFPEDVIAYELGLNVPEKEISTHSLLWDYIKHVKQVMENHDTSGWRVEQWDAHCPFFFECDPTLDFEETMQEERDTWT